MTVKQEDPNRRKFFRSLSFKEVSPVTRGGHQNAKIAIVRNNPETPMSTRTPTFLERLSSIFSKEKLTRGDSSEMEAPTTAEILRKREVTEKMYRVQGAFEESIWRIMNHCKGKELVKRLKTSVDEYGDAMERLFSETEGKEDMKRSMDEAAESFTRSLLAVAEVVANHDDSSTGLTPNEVERIERVLDPKHKPSPSQPHGDTVDPPNNQEPPMFKTLAEALKAATPAEMAELKRTLVDTPATEKPPAPEELLRNALPEDKRPLLDGLLQRITAVESNNGTLVERLAKLEDEKTLEIHRAAAKEFVPFIDEEAALELVRSGNTKLIEANRKAMKAMATKSTVQRDDLLRERGSATMNANSADGGGAFEEINREAKTLMAEKPAEFPTMAEAREHVRNTKPELRQRETEETSA